MIGSYRVEVVKVGLMPYRLKPQLAISYVSSGSNKTRSVLFVFHFDATSTLDLEYFVLLLSNWFTSPN